MQEHILIFKEKIPEGIFLAAVPIVAYWFCYIYQFGYCKYYGVPIELIEVNALSVFVGIIGIAFFAGASLTCSEIIRPIYLKFPKILQVKLRLVSIPVLIGLSILYIVKAEYKEILIVISSVFFPILFIEFALPILSQYKVKGYWNKLTADLESNFKYESTTDVILKHIGVSSYVMTFYFVIASVLICAFGSYQARKQDTFIVSFDNMHVVLKKYDGNFIYAKFNREKREVYSVFSMVKIESNIAEFSVQKIGTLTPSVELKN